VSKKKRTKKKKNQDLLKLSPEEEIALDSLLENLNHINLNNINQQLTSPQLASALVERLSVDDSGSADIILAIRDAFNEKIVQKAIKKTIFRFKQKGITFPDLEPPKETPFAIKKTDKDKPAAYLGPIDGVGNRGIFIVLPQMPKGIDIGMGILSDEEGIIQFILGRYSKKRMREVKDFFFEQVGTMVESTLPHAVTILEKAYNRNKPGSEELTRDYLQLRPWILENIPLLDQSIIYDSIPLENVSDEILTDSRIDKLFGHELMESWIIQPEEIKSLFEKIVEVQESRILVSEAQKSDRIKEIKDQELDQLFPDSKRSTLKERLEEMAYIFLKLDAEEYSRLSLISASSLDEKDSILGVNPFLEAMLKRSLDYYQQASEEFGESQDMEEDSSSSIIIP
jgi:hypothetical protein